jgi:hypothetical protein
VFGTALAIGILLDATVIRAWVVPAVITLWAAGTGGFLGGRHGLLRVAATRGGWPRDAHGRNDGCRVERDWHRRRSADSRPARLKRRFSRPLTPLPARIPRSTRRFHDPSGAPQLCEGDTDYNSFNGYGQVNALSAIS